MSRRSRLYQRRLPRAAAEVTYSGKFELLDRIIMKLKVRHHKTVRGFLVRIKQQTRTHTSQKNQHELQRASSYCELQLQNSPLVISMCLFVQHIFSLKTSLYQNTHFCVLLIIHALRNIRDSVQTTFRTTSSETTGDTLSDAGHSLGSVRDPQALQALRRDVQQDRVLGRSPASCNEAYFS